MRKTVLLSMLPAAIAALCSTGCKPELKEETGNILVIEARQEDRDLSKTTLR